ncbi:MAG: TerD family protein [Fibrobacterota bacterium]|nr:MAG: TerD family protein [Fibrobacterota bacterium]
MSVLKPGANANLSPWKFALSISYGSIPDVDIDVSAFLLTEKGKVRGDGDMCFYGQPQVGSGAVILNPASGSKTKTEFSMDLAKVDRSIEKIVLVMTIHENRAVMGKLSEIAIDVPECGGLRGEISCTGMTETALILAEIYRRGEDWKLRVVGQGFENGLSAIATHFGVDIASPAQASPTPTKAPVPEVGKQPELVPINLKHICLTKQGESSKIPLKKGGSDPIRVKATWIDNGDGRSDNDDLDLRAGILMPNGKMHWLASSHPGALDKAPFARHLGDVQNVSRNAPGTEIIELNPEISKRLGGPVGFVFSVYSAISNGDVSIASLHPAMSIEHDGTVVECKYEFPDGQDAEGVYTYVIGTVDIDDAAITVRLSGLTSPPESENTPWIVRKGGLLAVSFDGVPVFKEGRGLLGRLFGGGQKSYANA